MSYRVTQVCLAGAITHDYPDSGKASAADMFELYKGDERTLYAVLIANGKVVDTYPVSRRRKVDDTRFGPANVINDPHIATAIDAMPLTESRREDGVTWIDIRDAGRMAGIAVIAEREHNGAYA